MASIDIDLDVFSCSLDGVSLIEASAGTGKTWNICGLYLRQLLERDLQVGALLVVTFTKAATAELSTRIRDRIVDTLRVLDGGDAGPDPFVPQLIATVSAAGVDPAQMRQRLRHALQTFDEAAIFTIHGFCQRALADTPFAAVLPYAVELVEDDSALRLEVAQDFWRREVASGALPQVLVESLVQRGDCPDTWAAQLKAAMGRPLAQARWDESPAPGALGDAGDALVRAYGGAVVEWVNIDAAMSALDTALDGLNKNSYKPEAIERARQQWSDWLGAGNPLHALPAEKERKLHLLAADTLNDKTTKDGLKRGISPPQHGFFDAAAALLEARRLADEGLEAARLQLLRRFLEQGAEDLRRRKRERRLISFDDILWNAYEALHSGTQSWLAAALHARYPVALIDEFQDTDPLQFAIFDRIYRHEGRHGSLFLVGDPKQAIYSFRSADLFTYLSARDRADTRYSLGRNQRSTPALIEACNRLFGANPAVFMLRGLDYRAVGSGERTRAPLVDDTHSGTSPAALRLWRIPRDEAQEGEEGGNRLPRALAMQRSAAATAAEIARLLAAGARGAVRIGERGLAPGDIAVLVRSHGQGARMRQALARMGVVSVELSQASVFATEDAEELERVLLAISEPARERRVKAALATTLMGCDAQALAALSEDEAALLDVLDRFAGWRDTWLRHGFGVMLRRWMADDGVAARLLARDDGERRLTNLMHLAELLQQTAGSASPEVLLRTLATRRTDASAGEAAQLRLESDRNLVQIITIHRAKGLEYGVVFCPFLFDGHPAKGDSGPMRAWHDDTDQLILDYRMASATDKEIAARQLRERQAEDMRLIYVALTRAVHRCYLTVGCYAKTSFGRPSYSEGARSLLNWMVAGAEHGLEKWREAKLSPAEVDAQWRSLVGRSVLDGRPVMALEDLPDGSGDPLAPAEAGGRAPRAQRPPQIPSGWRMGSFSALISGASHESAALDHDARILPQRSELDEAGNEAAAEADAGVLLPPAADDILRFPRGPAAGDCLHAAFENVDFTDPDTWDDAIATALRAHPQPAANAAEAERHPRMLRHLLEDVLATALVEAVGRAPLLLSRIAKTQRMVELGFQLPAPHLSAARLNAWLADKGYRMPRLGFSDLAGYLKGFIDLVFEHDGRFWVLDWKSNHLGERPADYGPAALEGAMQSHGYHLQHLLYTVALHRHLARSLPGYDYDTHFGGVLYLFVRGVRPGWHAGGGPAGVFRHRAPRQVIEALDDLLAARARVEGVAH
ncbi:exodeoxyribonuclease V subunit beta [Parazoarcus communis]|uniref:RecBCD enzyme subunit RecB n=1 Tax=Parazoarcus communis TaxID=41977 RepID=A0A2U8GRS4_9RHOO|nr:exodeoxyribonuclease V subunit beta [Parazoarcus communis]AWI76158.1 exodeoxyribonuclease V subunit beta [Parazoarcus communis]